MAGKSPFKLLDAYGKRDKDIFFGREEEVEALYEMAYQTNLILVYGPSGSGKTSLVQCGLANRFQPSDWFDIYIRRGENINAALQRSLRSIRLEEVEEGTLFERLAKIQLPRLEGFQPAKAVIPATDITRTLRDIYEYHLKPIYLIFDQFEELYILGSAAEQQAFYHTIAEILNTEDYCRIIIILREEYLAELDAFEKVIPYLFEKRLRVEPMTRHNTNEVITGTTEKFGIRLKGEDTSALIIDALAKGQKRVELAYLQVFLDKLYRKASKKETEQVVFDNQLVQQLGNIENILKEFLDSQAGIIQERLQQTFPASPTDGVKKVLNAFVTLEGTKHPLKKEEVNAPGMSQAQVDFCLSQLEKARLFRLEGGLYELAHDALAQQIAQERSEEEVAILQITKIVKDRFSAYETTKSLLDNKEIRLLEVHRKQLQDEGRFNPEEWAFIRKSIWEDKLWSRIRFGMLLAAAAVLIAFTAYSNYYKNVYFAEKENVKRAYDSLTIVHAERQEAKFNEYLAKARKSMDDARYSDAVKELGTALDFDSTREEAIALKQQAENKLGLADGFNRLIAEGDSLFTLGETHYLDALERYREAAALDFNPQLARAKTSQVTEKLGGAFEKFKSAGDALFEGRGYRYALNAYRQAARIRPGDDYVQNRITECRERMGG